MSDILREIREQAEACRVNFEECDGQGLAHAHDWRNDQERHDRWADHLERVEAERDEAIAQHGAHAGFWGGAASRAIRERDRVLAELHESDRAYQALEQRLHEMEDERDRLRDGLRDIANMPHHDQDDAHRLRHKAVRALSPTTDDHGEASDAD